MSKVAFNISMSLDGFVAGPNHEVDRIFGWYFTGSTDYPFPGSPYVFKLAPASIAILEEASRNVGAIITGRRNFDLAGAWDGHPPLGVPQVVMTHRVPQEWTQPDSPFTFVTEGIERAVETAKSLAAGKDVTISSGNVMRQCLAAGLLDEIYIDLVPLLLGEGIRLFEHLGMAVELEQTRIVEGNGVTHLGYRVVK